MILTSLGGTTWAALNAVPPGSPERCVVTWDQERKVFVDPCTSRLYAPDGLADDGRSLIRYQAAVNTKDQLEVDLNTIYSLPVTTTTVTTAPPTP